MKNLCIALASAALLFASCQGNPDAAIGDAKQATIDSMNAVNEVKQQVIDSMNTAKAKHRSSSREAGSYNSSTANTTSPAATTTTAEKKKGWSHTAKGAVVGAGAGAVTGALINKDHLKGAAIGTVIGAGVGAGTGAIVDHAKKKKEQQQTNQ